MEQEIKIRLSKQSIDNLIGVLSIINQTDIQDKYTLRCKIDENNNLISSHGILLDNLLE